MKRTMAMVVSAALLLGGTMVPMGSLANAQAETGQIYSMAISEQKAGIVKAYGGASIELEAVEKTDLGIRFTIVKKIP